MPGLNVVLQSPTLTRAATAIADGKLTPAAMGELVAAFASTAAGAALDGLRSGRLPPDQMLPIAQRGLDTGARADLAKLMTDTGFTAKLNPAAANFLRAVLGTETLRAGGVFESVPVAASDKSAVVAAVARMRDWISSGKLQKYYDAAIGLSTADASLKDEALRVFNALPAITPSVTAADMVSFGLWTAAPRNIEAMQTSARYMVGRQVKVKTNVNAQLPPSPWNDPSGIGKKFMTYNEAGPVGITARAKIVGEQGDNFLVQVEGKNDPLSVPKKEVIDLNQPHTYSSRTDYNETFTKAKVCEAAIRMSDDVAKLDFASQKTNSGGILRAALRGSENMVAVQKRCFQEIHDVIQMKYSDASAYKDEARVGYGYNSSVGRAAVRGHGVCTDQRQVMRDLAFPFAHLIGVDMRSVTGGVHRHTDRNASMEQQLRSYSGGAHDWLEVTFRPSMEMTVCDRTWRQVNMSLFEAYGPNGDRYPSGPAYDAKQIDVSPTDIKADGSLTVAEYAKQFGDANTSGRQGHMTATGNQG
jgi:hypothetical protein